MTPLPRTAGLARTWTLWVLLLAAVACGSLSGCAAAPEPARPQTVPQWLSQERPG
ncbi:MAG: hypothetical protein ACYC35_01840 [Pirellulales bacterium]